MKVEQHNPVSLNIQWSYVLCGSTSSFHNWIVCVASPNNKCPNAVYTIIVSVKFLSKNASYKLELHKFAPFKHLESEKNELILYDFFDYLHLTKKIPWLLFRETPMFHVGRVSRDKIPILPRSRYVFDQHPRRVCATSALFDKNPRKTTTVWTTRLSVGLFFFPVNQKTMPKQNKEWYGWKKGVCWKEMSIRGIVQSGTHWKINNGIEGPVLVELQRLKLETDRRSSWCIVASNNLTHSQWCYE